MKVLHVWNTAAVPSVLSKYLRKKGVRSDVIMRKSFDKFGFERLYSGFTIDYDVSTFEFYVIAFCKAFTYDILHVHAVDKFVQYSKIFHSRKPTILTYHGTDIRKRWYVNYNLWKKADLVTVSTPDLLEGAPNEVIYVPNPVDTEHFKRRQPYLEDTGIYVKANIVKYEGKGIQWAKEQARKLNVKLRFIDRIFPYATFPRVLEMFEYYFDRKIAYDTGEIIDALSLNALQFLALGGKVVFMDKIITGLPEQFKPDNVTKQWCKIYKFFLER